MSGRVHAKTFRLNPRTEAFRVVRNNLIFYLKPNFTICERSNRSDELRAGQWLPCVDRKPPSEPATWASTALSRQKNQAFSC